MKHRYEVFLQHERGSIEFMVFVECRDDGNVFGVVCFGVGGWFGDREEVGFD